MAIALEAIDRTRPGLESARKNLTGFQQQAQQTGVQVRQAMTGAMQGMTMAASSALMLYNAYDALGPIQARLIRLQARRQATEAAIINYQRMLNKLTEEGRVGTEQYTYYQMQLSAAQERLRATTLLLEDAQDEMAKAYINIALSAIPMVTMALNNFSLTTVRNVIPAIRGMSAAFLASPIGIITVAVTGLIAALGWVTKGFKDWTVVTEALNTALHTVLTPLASFLDFVGNFIPEAKKWAEALRGVKVDLSGLSVIGESIDKLTGSLIPAAQATDSLQEAASNIALTLPNVQAQIQAATEEISALGDEGWEAQTSISQLNVTLQNTAASLDEVALAAENAWDAIAPSPEQLNRVYRETAEQITDLRGLLFDYAVRPSKEFQASLEEIAEYTWEQLRREGVSSLASLRDKIKEFADKWGVSWSLALSLIRREIEDLAEAAKEKGKEAIEVAEKALATFRQLPGAGVTQTQPAFPVGSREWAQQMYAQQYAQYMAQANLYEQRGQPEMAALYRRYAESAARAMREVQAGRLTVTSAQRGLYTFSEMLAYLHPHEFVTPEPKLREVIREVIREQPLKVEIPITFEHVEISSKEDVDYLLTQLEDLIVEKAKALRGGRIG
jgi:hypothetical protein